MTPAIDVECDDKALTVRAEVPGVDPEEIKVRIPLPSEHKNEPVTITPTAA